MENEDTSATFQGAQRVSPDPVRSTEIDFVSITNTSQINSNVTKERPTNTNPARPFHHQAPILSHCPLSLSFNDTSQYLLYAIVCLRRNGYGALAAGRTKGTHWRFRTLSL
jgi:hypothetical protein